jgi:hypothetical protein
MAIKQHGVTRLVWNEIEPGHWQAGGLSRHFSIVPVEDGTFSMRQRIGDAPSQRIGNFKSLRTAQFAAQRIIDAECA